MTNKEIEVLMQACRMAGLDATKISPENPFKKSGKTADLLQAAVSEIDPVQSARWRRDSGQGLSVATMAELQSGDALSSKAKQDLYLHDPQFVRDCQRQVSNSEQQMIEQMEKASADMRLKNTMLRTSGNAAMAQRLIAEEDAANQAHAEKQAAWTTGVQS